jgi:general stress protein 26
MTLEMTDAELEAFLADHRHCYVGTVSEQGWPHVAPLSYTRLDEPTTLYVRTHPKSRKAKNLYHENRASVVVDEGDEYAELRGFFAHAYATVVRAEDRLTRLDETFLETQYGGKMPDLLARIHARQDEWVWFELDAAHVVTWDNSKIDPERLPEPPADGPTYAYGFPEDAGAAEPLE